jgi:predicted kinase
MTNTKPTLILMVGLPRSGKSTFLRAGGYQCVVSPDEIRRYLGCFPFTAHMEPMVWWLTRLIINVLFAAGAWVVVLDATNVSKRRRDEWDSSAWVRQYIVIDTPKEVCIARAIQGGNEYLVPVIHRMAKEMQNDPSDFPYGESMQWVATGANSSLNG